MNEQRPRTYLAVCTSADYLEGLLALHASLRRVRSRYPLTVLLTPSLPTRVDRVLEGFGLRVLRTERLLDVPDEILRRNRAVGSLNWSNTFEKLRAFELTEFDKIVYLDSDMVVLRNIDELFERPHLSAVVAGKHFPGNEDWELLNSGCMVIAPRAGALERLWAAIPDALRQRNAIGDQDLLQICHPDWPERAELHLGDEYNMFFPYLEHYSLVHGFSLGGRKPVKIVHFTGSTKPWQTSHRHRVRLLGGLLLRRQWRSFAVLAGYNVLLVRAHRRTSLALRTPG